MAAHLTVARMICACATLPAAFAHATCSNGVVIVKGKVENAPPNAIVRVELLYPKHQGSDSAEVTLENESFTVKVPFFTQSRAPVLNGNLFERCNRKPSTVIVSLRRGDQEHDRISLDIAKDFEILYPGAYTLRSQIVLHGPAASHASVQPWQRGRSL